MDHAARGGSNSDLDFGSDAPGAFRFPGRLLILGLDGATWNVLDPARRRGLIPNLAALFDAAATGVLRSTVPPVTSAAWTTFMTGCGPGRHGVFDHRWYDAASGRMKVNHSGRARVPTFWGVLSDAGRDAVCLNLPGTYPPPPHRGIFVSGMDAPHLEGALSAAPAEFARRLRAEVPEYHLGVLWKEPPSSLEGLRAAAAATRSLFLGRARGGLLADACAPDWSALMVQFQNLDPFQHRAWRYLDVDDTGIDRPEWNDAAWSVLSALDEAAGLLLELAAKRGAAVLVVSDHGFGRCLGRVQINRVLMDAGLIREQGVAGRAGRRLGRWLDQGRLWLAKRRDPKARGASFETSIPALYPYDWRRTLGFAPHQDTAGLIYLNSVARAPRHPAPLRTPREVDDAKAAFVQALRDARHPERDVPLFPEIVDVAAEYALDPAREGFPDLIALPDEDYWVRTKHGPGLAWVEPDPKLPGNHRPDGIVALAGCGLAPGRRLKARLEDVAPTVLALFGLPAPETMVGRTLEGVTPAAAPASGSRTTPAPVPAPAAAAAAVAAPAAGFEHSAEEQELIERRLRELGYLE